MPQSSIVGPFHFFTYHMQIIFFLSKNVFSKKRAQEQKEWKEVSMTCSTPRQSTQERKDAHR